MKGEVAKDAPVELIQKLNGERLGVGLGLALKVLVDAALAPFSLLQVTNGQLAQLWTLTLIFESQLPCCTINVASLYI